MYKKDLVADINRRPMMNSKKWRSIWFGSRRIVKSTPDNTSHWMGIDWSGSARPLAKRKNRRDNKELSVRSSRTSRLRIPALHSEVGRRWNTV